MSDRRIGVPSLTKKHFAHRACGTTGLHGTESETEIWQCAKTSLREGILCVRFLFSVSRWSCLPEMTDMPSGSLTGIRPFAIPARSAGGKKAGKGRTVEEESVHSDSIPDEILYADAEHKTDCG